jgi:octanoyl-[GcvH]:protein N-octanoyltransferase
MDPFKPFKQIRLIDVDLPLDQQLQTDKTLSLSLQQDELILRLWSAKGVILGKMDSVLPEFQAGLDFLESSHTPSYIRKAGGLAVVCDEGILNLSLIFSKETALIGGLNEAYDFGVAFQKALLHALDLNIQEGEISESYCPGKYDLSVNGQKFSGMAQYRSKDAIMVMITWCVEGDQQARCNLIKHFYALANPLGDPKYPRIDPFSMTTLSDLSNSTLSVTNIKSKIMIELAQGVTPVIVQKQL